MKAVWVDNGSDADVGKLRRHEITAAYFDPRDPRITTAYLDRVRGQGLTAGVYFAWNWYPALDGPTFAAKCSQEVQRLAPTGPLPVCLDIETHDMGYVVKCLRRWRELRPTRTTDLTIEGMQGGLLDSTVVRALIDANVRLAPSFYGGQMEPLAHSVVIDVLMTGFPGSRIVGMYDAAALPYRWNGYAFTQGRLP